MKKKTITRDLKLGLIVIGALFLLYFGLNFLKGINIFTSTYSYYAQYEDIGGLVVSTPVYIKGYKVGQVDEIAYDFSRETPFTIKISVSREIRLPEGTVIEMFDDGLMGGRAIRLLLPTEMGDTHHAHGDMLPSHTVAGLMATLTDGLLPKLETISQEADSLLRSLRLLVESETLGNTLASAEHAVTDMAAAAGSLRVMVNDRVPHVLGKADTLLDNLSTMSDSLKQIDYRTTFDHLDHVLTDINATITKMNDEEGTLGALLNDRSLYTGLTRAASAADSLLIDLRQHPKRYVHFSLFGRKN